MRKKKEYIIAGSLLSLAIVGMVFAYNTESGDKKAQEKEEQKVAFQEVEKDKETAKDEVEDVSSILKAKQKQEEQEQKQKAEAQKEEANVQTEESQVQETAGKASALTFKGELAWPAEGNVIMNYSMDQTVYFKSLDQYRYNPAVIIGTKVNDKVTAAAAGSVTDVSNNEVTGCTVTVNLGDGYKAIYGQLKEVSKKAGDYVAPGEVIGYISEPTKYYSEEGSNLYFELQKDDQPIDPMGYFK